jgi:pseudaminic acid biosynthesis-associated methylase
MKTSTEQEIFWAKEFGNSYLARNSVEELYPNKISLFSEITKNLTSLTSFLEFGPNSGVNLLALKNLFPNSLLSAVEINARAVRSLRELKICKNVWHDSILNFKKEKIADFSFTSGVLIHINPDHIEKAYETIYNSSKKYILICEYYNPSPVEIEYRGHRDKLFKRDFAGDLLLKYKDLNLINYGFRYNKDNSFPLDDVTWFLLKKN